MSAQGLDHVEHVGPDTDARYVRTRTPRRPDMCPACFSTDTELDSGEPLRRCLSCGEVFK